MHRHLLAVFALLLPLGAQPAAAQSSRAQLALRIDSLVNATLAADRTPGINLAVVQGNDTIVLKGYGFADVENNVRVSPESVFRIGSVTKQFTAAAIMKLVEAGQLRLEATVGDYIPEYQGPGRQATVHQLLNHTSGIKSYTALGPKFWGQSRLDLTHAQMLELFMRDSLDFAPGTAFSYNNSGYYLLGMIIEKVTGQTYAQHLQTAQWGPLGLKQTLYCGQREIIPHRAQGYELQDGYVVNAAPLSMNAPYSAGALCSTPRDLVRWTRALHGGKVVSPESFAKMIAPTRLTSGSTNPYGYGIVSGRNGDAVVIQHGGGINGFTASLAHYPASSLTIAVLANGPTNTDELEARIARAVLGIPEPVVIDLPTTAAERARYVGTYDLAPTLQMQIRVFEQDNRLFAQATNQGAMPLRKQAEHTFDGPQATTIRMTFTLEGERAAAVAISQGGRVINGRRVQ